MASEKELRESIVMEVAMWADMNLFGHGLDRDDYEVECERLTDKLYDDLYETLAGRERW